MHWDQRQVQLERSVVNDTQSAELEIYIIVADDIFRIGAN